MSSVKILERVVLVTTTLAKNTEEFEIVRAQLALKTIAIARKHGYEVIAIDGGSPQGYVNTMLELGAHVYPEALAGMGNCRRQAIKTGLELISSGKPIQVIVWLEPEKYTLVPLLYQGVSKIISQELELVMFRRTSLYSYPPEQRCYYEQGRLAFFYLTGMALDYPFGPVTMSPQVSKYFLDYKSEYGDLWDSILIPKFRAIRAGVQWAEVDVEYVNPPEQTYAETGNMKLFVKRVAQLQNLISSVQTELDSGE